MTENHYHNPQEKKIPRTAWLALCCGLYVMLISYAVFIMAIIIHAKIDPVTGQPVFSGPQILEDAFSPIVVPSVIFCVALVFCFGIYAKRTIKREPTRWRGKILVELAYSSLIMVFLLTIAAPNFMLFSTRYSVETVRQSLGLKADVIDVYYEDHQAYPPWATGAQSILNDEHNMPSFQVAFQDKQLPTLTTPMPYIKEYYHDRHSRTYDPNSHLRPFGYFPFEQEGEKGFILVARGTDHEFNLTSATLKAVFASTTKAPADILWQKAYDPTNGTSSAGDIWLISKNGERTSSIKPSGFSWR